MTLRSTIDTFLKQFEKPFVTHNRIEVSKSALLHNVDFFHRITNEQIIPVLKGNAYGHGIEQVAIALRGQSFPYIAVDGYFEALRIRAVSDQPVLIMGAIAVDNYGRLTYDKFAFVVQDEASIRALGATGKHVNVHLECNTGMNRYGAATTDIPKLIEVIRSYPTLTLEGVMSHLADSDGDDDATVTSSVQKFDNCVDIVRTAGAAPTMFHVAQSAGSIKADSQYANTIRLGIGLYGINPFPYDHALYEQFSSLRPALKLVSTITKTTDLHAGDQVSYNYTYTAPADMQIGVLPLGYYEGVDRALSNIGVVSHSAGVLPITGRVCMNHTMIDLKQTGAKVGDEVVVYSNNPRDDNSIDSIVRLHGLFSYGLLTSLSGDVRRVLVE